MGPYTYIHTYIYSKRMEENHTEPETTIYIHIYVNPTRRPHVYITTFLTVSSTFEFPRPPEPGRHICHPKEELHAHANKEPKPPPFPSFHPPFSCLLLLVFLSFTHLSALPGPCTTLDIFLFILFLFPTLSLALSWHHLVRGGGISAGTHTGMDGSSDEEQVGPESGLQPYLGRGGGRGGTAK